LTPRGNPSATAECIRVLKQYPAGVITDISPDDPALLDDSAEDVERLYRGHGRAMLDCIRIAMIAAYKDAPRSILDFASGHGRVLRLLKAEYPDAALAACDTRADAVEFCAERFGATPILGKAHPGEIELPQRYDLIWCGSLLTHLDGERWSEFFDFFANALEVGGLLVVTVSGRSIAAEMRDPATAKWFNPSFADEAELGRYLGSYEREGFAYAEYALSPEQREVLAVPPGRYGVSLVKPSWVVRLLEDRPMLQLVTYAEGRWGLMDVIGLVRVERVQSPSPLGYDLPLGGVGE
jgi:SAM-dependent methyltransferase